MSDITPENITVITSITGGKDNLVLGNTGVKGQNYLAYVDGSVPNKSPEWTLKPAYDRFESDRRNSRVPKILSHLYTNTKYSIWIDGNMRLVAPPVEIVGKYLKDHDIATFKHPVRDCIYEEATICAKAYLDDPEVIIEQVRRYEIDGYPKKRGLCECMLIVRRHTPKVEQFNNTWWAEYCRGSVRDQISFMYAADKAGIRVNVINEQFKEMPNGTVVRAGVLEVVSEHCTLRAEPQ